MRLSRTSVESVSIGIESASVLGEPPQVAIGIGVSSPGPDAEWVDAAWVVPGTEATVQVAGPESGPTSAARAVGIGHNYLYVRFGTVVRKADGVIEVR